MKIFDQIKLNLQGKKRRRRELKKRKFTLVKRVKVAQDMNINEA